MKRTLKGLPMSHPPEKRPPGEHARGTARPKLGGNELRQTDRGDGERISQPPGPEDNDTRRYANRLGAVWPPRFPSGRGKPVYEVAKIPRKR